MLESQFCMLHTEAMKNLEGEYERWCKAFGEEISKREYFERLLNLDETGAAVKSVIVYVRQRQVEAA